MRISSPTFQNAVTRDGEPDLHAGADPAQKGPGSPSETMQKEPRTGLFSNKAVQQIL